jgi:hypothetical protein
MDLPCLLDGDYFPITKWLKPANLFIALLLFIAAPLFNQVCFVRAKIKNPLRRGNNKVVAEREGFEPPVPLQAHLISSQAHSTALASLRVQN